MKIGGERKSGRTRDGVSMRTRASERANLRGGAPLREEQQAVNEKLLEEEP